MTKKLDEQDKFLNAALGASEPEAPSEEPAAEAAAEPEHAEEVAEEADEAVPDTAPDGESDTPDASPDTAPEKPAALGADDEKFAFTWLARAGLSRAKVNKLLDEDPELALELARAQKQAQDTIARTRREASSARVDDEARPSDSARAQTEAPPPEENRRAKWLQLVEDEYGEEDRQALERDLASREARSAGGGPAVDARLAATVEATRERLVASGHDELREQANYLAVLKAADVLMAADGTLSVPDAIAEAAETLKARAERRQAASQQTRRALATSQPVTANTRPLPPKLSVDQARDRWLDLKLAGKQEEAEAVRRRYKL